MRSHETPAAHLHDVRVRDPASRDQDAAAWRRGRFEERVRREWNPVTAADIAPARRGDGHDLDALAARIQGRVGGDAAAIRRRLAEFEAAEREGAHAAPDPLAQPGRDA